MRGPRLLSTDASPSSQGSTSTGRAATPWVMRRARGARSSVDEPRCCVTFRLSAQPGSDVFGCLGCLDVLGCLGQRRGRDAGHLPSLESRDVGAERAWTGAELAIITEGRASVVRETATARGIAIDIGTVARLLALRTSRDVEVLADLVISTANRHHRDRDDNQKWGQLANHGVRLPATRSRGQPWKPSGTGRSDSAGCETAPILSATQRDRVCDPRHDEDHSLSPSGPR